MTRGRGDGASGAPGDPSWVPAEAAAAEGRGEGQAATATKQTATTTHRKDLAKTCAIFSPHAGVFFLRHDLTTLSDNNFVKRLKYIHWGEDPSRL